MLSLFPEVLFLAPIGTALLRVTVALYLVYIAWYLIQNQDAILQVRMPLIGSVRAWMVQISAMVIAGIAVCLLIGAWTQLVAVLASLVVTKHLVYYRRYENMLPFSRGTYVLLLMINLSLVVTGAGAFALDLPL